MGRTAKTVEQHLANGKTKPSRVNYEVPDFPTPEMLTAPKTLKGAGLKMWNDLIKTMVDTRALRTTDLPAFIDRCMLETEMTPLRDELQREDLSIADRMNMSRHLLKLRAAAYKLTCELGLTPVSRSRVKTGVRNPNLPSPPRGAAGGKASAAAANRERFFGPRRVDPTSIAEPQDNTESLPEDEAVTNG